MSKLFGVPEKSSLLGRRNRLLKFLLPILSLPGRLLKRRPIGKLHRLLIRLSYSCSTKFSFPFYFHTKFLISDVGREEEAFDPLFSYREGEEADYFNLEDLEDQLHNFRSFSKVDVPLQGDKDEDMKILEL